MPPVPKLTTSLKTLSWAAYLACSWTWCIGMFLPILLLRDYGPWGFVVFAVPNVLGAAAMGFVLTRRVSHRLVQAHKVLISAFSIVTVAYHFFFVLWLTDSGIFMRAGDATGIARISPTVMALLPVLGISTWLLLRPASDRRQRTIATVTWMLSMLTIMLSFAHDVRVDRPPSQPFSLVGLAPVSFFGFLLCPYLDATFHHVRRSTNREAGRVAFALGFGVFFALMILGTLTYRDALMSMIHPEASFRHVSPFEFDSLIFHLMLQMTFTVIVHAIMLRRLGLRPLSLALPALIGVVAGFSTRLFDTFPALGMTTGELTYRLFLSFYGLVFPAYVYLCMVPTPDRHAGLAGPSGRRKRNTWLASVAIAAPFFWMGFIERRELFLLPGLAIILLARLTLPAGPGLPKRTSRGGEADPLAPAPGRSEPRA